MSAESAPPPPRRDKRALLTALWDAESAPSPPAPETLPPYPAGLERYLPEYLWQKLHEDAPGVGVLLNALNRLRAVLALISAFLPEHLVAAAKRAAQPGQNTGDWLAGSLLFCDVSGFTALSEQLAQREDGAEVLTRIINDYFEQMLDILARSGGILLKFAGDALLAYFPAQAAAEQARWAAHAAQRMLRALASFAPVATAIGEITLRMKIGVSTGGFVGAGVGTTERMEYIVFGPTVARALAAEGHAAAAAKGSAQVGLIVADAATAAAIGHGAACPPEHSAPLEDGFVILSAPDESLDDFEIKAAGRRRPSSALWDHTVETIIAEMTTLVAQLDTLTPYQPPTLVERLITGGKQRSIESEFRPTVVLFGNFTGFEALLPSAAEPPPTPQDVQRLTRMIGEYFTAMQAAVAHYGGIISRIDPYTQGSKILILFGAPVTHEDDAQRAVHTALALLAALHTLNTRWQRREALPAPPVALRIGITQGWIFATEAGSPTRHEYTVMGDDVNLAARLMSAAQPGQILLSQHLYEATGDTFDITPLPAITVKGKSKPIPIYQVEGLRGDRLGRRIAGRKALVEREDLLLQAKALLQKALARRHTLLTLQGSAGIGKSHFVDALAAHAQEQGVQVYLAECAAYTATAPYAPWIALLHTLAGNEPAMPPEQRKQHLRQRLAALQLTQASVLGPLGQLLGWPDLAPPFTLGPGETGATLAAAAAPLEAPQRAGLFAQLGQKVTAAEPPTPKPSLWQVAQERQKSSQTHSWAQLEARVTSRERQRLFDAMALLLERLAAQAPLMLIFEDAQWMDTLSQELFTFLDDHLRAQPVLLVKAQRETASREADGATLTLPPLSLAGTGALLARELLADEETALPEALVALAHERTGGNPLYLAELAHWLGLQADHSPDALAAALRASLTLQELILSRIDRLPAAARAVVRAAAVVGPEFCRSDLPPLLPDPALNAQLDEALAQLRAHALIQPLESGQDPRYAFQQTLVRELAYDSLAFARRRELHARIAAHLEARHADDLEAHAELLAFHHEQARQSGPAARYLILAGRKARQRYAYPQAADFYRRALAALETASAAKEPDDLALLLAQTHQGLGEIALLEGDFAAAAAAFEKAAQLPVPPDLLADLQLRLALVLPLLGDAARAEALARQVAAQRPGSLAALATLAWLLCRRGAATEAAEPLAQATALAAAGTDRWSLELTALLSDLQGDWETALGKYQALEHPAGAALAACRLGDQKLAQGQIEPARARYDQAAALWEKEADAWGLALARYRQAAAFQQSSDAPSALARLEEARILLDNIPEMAQEDRRVVADAYRIVTEKTDAPWPHWNWQRYEDSARILLLFVMSSEQ